MPAAVPCVTCPTSSASAREPTQSCSPRQTTARSRSSLISTSRSPRIDAVAIVRELGPLIGGGGGGRPTLAEAGGKNVEGIRDALAAGRDRLTAALA